MWGRSIKEKLKIRRTHVHSKHSICDYELHFFVKVFQAYTDKRRERMIIMRILQVLPSLKTDGIAAVVMNYYKNIDKSKIQFDFAVENKLHNKYDDFIAQSGGKIYRLTNHTSRNMGFLRYFSELRKLVKEQKYSCVHIHSNSSILCFLGGMAVKSVCMGGKSDFFVTQ